jgi:sugar phosphate permease
MSFTRASYSLVIDSAANTDTSQPTAAELDRLYRKLSWRLMPLFCLCIMLNYLDRTSLAFASIQMTEQLNFSPEVLGLGGGLFFISYCLMQVRVCRCRRFVRMQQQGCPVCCCSWADSED